MMRRMKNTSTVARRNRVHFSVGFVILFVLGFGMSGNAAELGPVSVHGTFSQGYIHSQKNNFVKDSKDGTFAFREYGINAVYSVDKWRIGGQVFGRELGSVANDRIFLDWLSVDYAMHDALGFRFGKLKIPYGFYGSTRDIESLRAEVLLPQGVYMEYIRGIYNSTWGGEIYGYLPTEKAGGFSYLLQYGVRDIDDGNGEMANLLTRSGQTLDEVDEKDSMAASLVWDTPVDGLRLGTTFSWCEFDYSGQLDPPGPLGLTPYDADVSDFMMCMVSAEYTRGPLTLTSEIMGGSLDAVTRSVGPTTEYKSEQLGGYLRGDYYLLDQLALGAGFTYFKINQEIDVGGTVSKAEEDMKDTFLSLRFDITDNLTLKVEQHYVNGTAGVFSAENPTGQDEHWSMTLVKLSYFF